MPQSKLPSIRLNKYLADKGVASRREADVLIADQKVLVNGIVATLGQKVSDADRVEIKKTDTKHTYIIYYKPHGIVTHSPASNEVDVVTRIARDHNIHHVYPVGRLAKNAEGLLLLTDDGRITKQLQKSPYTQVYEITVNKPITDSVIHKLSRGVLIEGIKTEPMAVRRGLNDYSLEVTIQKAERHHLERVCTTLGYQVQTLRRTQFGPFALKSLRPGMFHRLSKKEVLLLYRALEIM